MAGEKFRAGAAMVDITPSRELVNYNGDRLSIDADASPLRCHAAVFEDGETKGAILSVDTTFIDRTFLLRIRDACERATGVPGTNILVAATHTHPAPASCVSFLSGALPDPQYLDQMVEGVVEAVVTA